MILLLNIARYLMVLWNRLRLGADLCAQRRSQPAQPDQRRHPSHRGFRHRLLAGSDTVGRVAPKGC